MTTQVVSHSMLIAGQPQEALSREVIPIEDPCTAEPFATVPAGGVAEVNAAVAAAQAAHEDRRWSGMERRERARILLRIAQLFEAHHDELAEIESRSTGRPIAEMSSQLRRIPEWFEYFASVSRTEEGRVPPFGGNYLNYTTRVPLGVVAHITPWNHPILIWVKKLAPALAAGNTIVVKPSELAPLGPLALARICQEAGVPDGVINVVTGYGASAGARLSAHPAIRKLDLTGGTSTGKAAAAAAGSHLASVTMELGGKGAIMIFNDVDIDEAVDGAAFASFIATGQTCVQGSRILVQGHDRANELARKLQQKISRLKVGHSLDSSTQLGPLISGLQRSRVSSMVDEAEQYAEIIRCSRIPSEEPLNRGYYYPATLIVGASPQSVIATEEVFGPVTVILPFETEQEAIAIANGTPYGLSSSVWTRDIARAHRVAQSLDCGVIWINDHHRIDPSSPWGGMKESGIGSENGLETYNSYTRPRSIVVNVSSERFDWYSDTGEEQRYS
jgi:phenylacetaldehyde dehydrogenase